MNPIHIQQHPSPPARRQRGFSLVEILVALTISVFLISGVVQLFISSRQTYRYHNALSRIEENGRFALEVMARDIRMAGHYGCLPAALITNPGAGAFRNQLNTPNNYIWNFAQPIQGSRHIGGNWEPEDPLDASITSPLVQNNLDVLTVRGTDGPIAVIDAHAGPLDNPRARGTNFNACDVVVAANCAEASVFQVTGIAPASAIVGPPPIPDGQLLQHASGGCGNDPGNSVATLGTTFLPQLGSEVTRVSTKSYYIRTGASGRPALWRRVGPDNPQELVEGVERMEIRYGVCTGTGAARSVNPAIGYVRINDPGFNLPGDWPDVCSVRIDLLLASLEDNLVTTPQTVVFPADTGIQLLPAQLGNDRRLRQGFSTTVGIRNRLP
jgi:type IV pilus assembly protein PilW